MYRHSLLLACVAWLLAGCASTAPYGSSAPERQAAGQWQSLEPEQMAAGFSGSSLLQPLGGRLRRTAANEILLEIYLANTSTAPGTNLISVAVDQSSFWSRGSSTTPPSGTYAVDAAKRLDLLSTYFPGEPQAGATEARAMPNGKVGLIPVQYPDSAACVFAWQAAGADDERWQPKPYRIFKIMRMCAPALEMEPLLRSFAGLDIHRIVTAAEQTATSDDAS